MEQSLGAIIREAMHRQGLNIKQLARLTADLDDPVSEGTIHNVVKERVIHPRYATIRPLCLALDLDYNAVLADLRRPAHQLRAMPDDFHHLTDEQWRCLVDVARQFRIANEGRQRSVGHADAAAPADE